MAPNATSILMRVYFHFICHSFSLDLVFTRPKSNHNFQGKMYSLPDKHHSSGYFLNTEDSSSTVVAESFSENPVSLVIKSTNEMCLTYFPPNYLIIE